MSVQRRTYDYANRRDAYGRAAAQPRRSDRAHSEACARKAMSGRSRALMALAGVILFTGLFVQLTMLARISSQSKRASALESECEILYADAENLELNINQFHNLDAIETRARQLGMENPSEGQIRVVNVARSADASAAVQAAGIGGAEGVQN